MSPSRSATAPSAASASGARLEKLLLATGQDHPPGDADDAAVLCETISADVAELRTRRALAQPSDSPPVPSPEQAGKAPEVDDQALLAAIERLDEIEFPARMRDAHKALFVAPFTRPLALISTGAGLAAARAGTAGSAATLTPVQASTTLPGNSPAGSGDGSSASGTSSTVQPLTLAHALPLLFTWCATTTRPLPAPHRRYAVSRLIALELERLNCGSTNAGRARRVTRSSSSDVAIPSVEDAFVRWIDERFPASSASAGAAAAGPPPAPVERRDARALAEELLRAGVMSYGAYLQRLIARGETEPRPSSAATSDASPETESVHLWILRTVALPASGVGARRRVASIGGEGGVARALRVEELAGVVRSELDRLVFGASAAPGAECGVLLRAVRELREEGAHGAVAREVLPEGLSARVDQATGRIGLEAAQMAVAVAVYEECEDWWGLVQVRLLVMVTLCACTG